MTMEKDAYSIGTKFIIGCLFLFLISGFIGLIYLLITSWPSNGNLVEETDAMKLVVFAGGLGSFVHIATSLTDFVGNKKFVASWTLWYIIRPLIGGGLALIVYLVIRGGLFAPTSASEGVLNSYGLVALSAMTGMFSKQATDKLREVFDTIFSTNNEVKRLNPLTIKKPKIVGLSPNTIVVNSTNREITIKGDEFTHESLVFLDNKKRQFDFLGRDELKIALAPDEVSHEKSITVKVVNEGIDDGESNVVSLKVVKDSA